MANGKTPLQKYNSLKKQGGWLRFGKYASISAPFITIAIVNWKDYFQQANGVSVGFGFVISMIILIISMMREAKKDTEKKFNNITVWGLAFGLTLLLQSILTDMVLIMGCGLGGQVVGTAFGTLSEQKYNMAKLYKESLIKKEVEKEG